MGYRDLNAFVPGVKDIVDGGYTLPDGSTALSFEERQARGKLAIQALADYQEAKQKERDKAKKEQKEMLTLQQQITREMEKQKTHSLHSIDILKPRIVTCPME